MKFSGSHSAGVLKSNPSNDSSYDINFTRVQCQYKNLSEKFKHRKKDFSRQFYHVYAARLAKSRELLEEKARLKWGPDVHILKLAELQENSGSKCVIIGTLYKHQELKPSILKEISEEFQLVPQQKITRFTSDEDSLVLEDELQRIRLLGNIDVHSAVTGVVCAVLGNEDESGKFHVEDVCWAGSRLAPSTFNPKSGNRYLVLLSGLNLADKAASLFPLNLFVDWVTGWLGGPSEQEDVSKIGHIMIAGNTIRGNPETKDGNIINTHVENSTDIMTAVNLADGILADITASVHVDVMPGEFDPTNFTLPQQPIHSCMFPKASRYRTLHTVTNPHCCSLEDRLVVGSSGQPINDIRCFSNITDPLAALEQTLLWGHMAPTAPDTLCSYPYYDDDPFIIQNQPDVYFVGNQENFQTKLVEIDNGPEGVHKTRLVCIPQFSTTYTCAVVDLTTLDCYPVKFDANSLSGVE